MPGLFARMSTIFQRELILKPAAFPPSRPWQHDEGTQRRLKEREGEYGVEEVAGDEDEGEDLVELGAGAEGGGGVAGAAEGGDGGGEPGPRLLRHQQPLQAQGVVGDGGEAQVELLPRPQLLPPPRVPAQRLQLQSRLPRTYYHHSYLPFTHLVFLREDFDEAAKVLLSDPLAIQAFDLFDEFVYSTVNKRRFCKTPSALEASRTCGIA